MHRVTSFPRRVVDRLRGERPPEMLRIAGRHAKRAVFGGPVTDFYQRIDKGHSDYQLIRVEGINRPIRGPVVDRDQPYIVCLGAAQTYGRYCERPFPKLLSDRLGVQVMNLGIGGAGPATFHDPALLEWLNGAAVVVAQVLSGRSAGNSMFDNSGSGGLMGTRMRDGERMRFEQFFDDLIEGASSDVVQRVIAETRDDYVRRFSDLLRRISAPTVLFWFSTREVDYQIEDGSRDGYFSDFPHLVDGPMMAELRLLADAYVELVSTEGLPQQLWRTDEEVPGANVEDGYAWNNYYPSPQMHAQAADILLPVCHRLLGETSSKSIGETR